MAHRSEMQYMIAQFIVSLSRVSPLEPGDVLATGSPPGGDVMRVGTEKIGELANPVVAATR